MKLRIKNYIPLGQKTDLKFPMNALVRVPMEKYSRE